MAKPISLIFAFAMLVLSPVSTQALTADEAERAARILQTAGEAYVTTDLILKVSRITNVDTGLLYADQIGWLLCLAKSGYYVNKKQLVNALEEGGKCVIGKGLSAVNPLLGLAYVISRYTLRWAKQFQEHEWMKAVEFQLDTYFDRRKSGETHEQIAVEAKSDGFITPRFPKGYGWIPRTETALRSLNISVNDLLDVGKALWEMEEGYEDFSQDQAVRDLLKRLKQEAATTPALTQKKTASSQQSGLATAPSASLSCVNIQRVAEMAKISRIAYNEEADAIKELKDLDYSLAQAWSRSDFEGTALWGIIRSSNNVLALAKDPQLILAKRNIGKKTLFVVAFRGTEPESLKDKLTDANIRQCPLTSNLAYGKVHCGYKNYAHLGLEVTRPVVVNALKQGSRDIEIVVTGHSLGGAAATLYAALLYEEGVPFERISVYTYGAPPVGDQTFRNRYSGILKNVLRMWYQEDENIFDPIPFVRDGGYEHLGVAGEIKTHNSRAEIIIDANNTRNHPAFYFLIDWIPEIKPRLPYHSRFLYETLTRAVTGVLQNGATWDCPAAAGLGPATASARPGQPVGPAAKGVAGGLASALVIDRSGSMAGEKLAKAKDGAGIYVKALSDADFASVSFFSSGASTEMPMTRYGKAVKDVDTVLSRIGATGSTNIGAGLEQGYAQLENLGVVSQSDKLALLLSDGMNNTGDWNTIVKKFKATGWPIFTVGYGQDRDEATLRKIAEMTGGTYTHADTTNVVDAYCKIHANAKNKSGPLSVKDPLAPDGKLSYIVYVSPGAQDLMVCTSWQGSRLETVLVSPSGMILGKKRLNGRMGRYDEGKTYQLLQVNKPQAGRWQVQVRWAEPPAAAEQVNISVSEKSDIFANILGFRPEYTPGEPVTINVQVAEVVGGQRVALRSPAVRVQVQKPGGPRMAQMLQTQRPNRAMYKNVVQRNTRGLTLVDDGAHDDYRADDGIFGGTFTETDENGAYLIFAIITGQKRTGRRIRRTLIASFQVGPISQNPVTTAQVLEVRDLLENRTDPAEAIEALQSDPLAAIKGSQSDPLDAINKLRQGVQ